MYANQILPTLWMLSWGTVKRSYPVIDMYISIYWIVIINKHYLTDRLRRQFLWIKSECGHRSKNSRLKNLYVL